MWLDLSFVVNHGHAWFANDSQKRDDTEQNTDSGKKLSKICSWCAESSRVLFIYVKSILGLVYLLGCMYYDCKRICKEKTFLLAASKITNVNIFLKSQCVFFFR